MTFRHLNDEDRAEIWDLHGQGYLAGVHNKTGRSFATVTALIKRHGGIRPARHPEPTGRGLGDGDREEIALGISAGDTYVEIAERIGRHHSTVSREVGRNGGRSKYRATAAMKATVERAKRPKDLKLDIGTALDELVREKLEMEWSPEQISAWLKVEHPANDEMRISAESIYVAVYTSTAGMTGNTSSA